MFGSWVFWLGMVYVTFPLGYLLCAPLSHASFVTFTEKVIPKLL